MDVKVEDEPKFHPEQIDQNELSELWFLTDTSFKVPKASYYSLMVTPSALTKDGNYDNALCNEMIAHMLNHKVQREY